MFKIDKSIQENKGIDEYFKDHILPFRLTSELKKEIILN